MKYQAFLSYSHRDKAWVDWLHRALETYKVPKALVGQPTPRGEAVPSRVFPVFRDREELPTAVDLGKAIGHALQESRYLIVVCSPASAGSLWVNEEILSYKRLGRENRVLAVVVDGEPNAADGKPGFTPDQECFPPALKFKLGSDSALSDERTEPIAADARPHADGRRNALLKLLAGVLGVNYDDLKRRDEEYQRRRLRRMQFAAGTFATLALVAGLAGWLAWRGQRIAAARETGEIFAQGDTGLVIEAGNRLARQFDARTGEAEHLRARTAETLAAGESATQELRRGLSPRRDAAAALLLELQDLLDGLDDITGRSRDWERTAAEFQAPRAAELQESLDRARALEAEAGAALDGLPPEVASHERITSITSALAAARDGMSAQVTSAKEALAGAAKAREEAADLKNRLVDAGRRAARSGIDLGRLREEFSVWSEHAAVLEAEWTAAQQGWQGAERGLAAALVQSEVSLAEWRQVLAAWGEYLRGYADRRARRPWLEHMVQEALTPPPLPPPPVSSPSEEQRSAQLLASRGKDIPIREPPDQEFLAPPGDDIPIRESPEINPEVSKAWERIDDILARITSMTGEIALQGNWFAEQSANLSSIASLLTEMEGQLRDLLARLEAEAREHRNFESRTYFLQSSKLDAAAKQFQRLAAEAESATGKTTADAVRLSACAREILVLTRVLPPQRAAPGQGRP